jgi:hypothetical protein
MALRYSLRLSLKCQVAKVIKSTSNRLNHGEKKYIKKSLVFGGQEQPE